MRNLYVTYLRYQKLNTIDIMRNLYVTYLRYQKLTVIDSINEFLICRSVPLPAIFAVLRRHNNCEKYAFPTVFKLTFYLEFYRTVKLQSSGKKAQTNNCFNKLSK